MAQVAKKCDACTEKHSAFWCYDCRKEYCKTCCHIHNGFPAHKKHIILNIEDVCKDHKYEHSRFCTTCESFVCKECVRGKHKQHYIDTIQKVASDYQENLFEIATEVVDNLKSVSELKVSMQSEQNKSLSTIKQFREDANKCNNKVKRIVKTVLDEYIGITTEFENSGEDAYEKTLNRIKKFEDTQSALHSKLKEVWKEKQHILFIILFLKIKENIQENQTIPCPPKRMVLVPFNQNDMVSTVVERITSEFKTKEQHSLSEQMNNDIKTLQKENKMLLQDNEKLRKDIERLEKDEKEMRKPTKILQEKEEELSLLNQKEADIQEHLKTIQELKEKLESKDLEVKTPQHEVERPQTAPASSERYLRELQMTIETLKGEKDLLMQRLSMVAGRKMKDNNPAIADLSDPNRPERLAEQFREIYDNAWTDVLDCLTENKKVKDEVAVKQLVDVLQAIYEQCKCQIEKRKQTIIKLIGYPEDTLEKQYTGGKYGHDPTVKIIKDLVKGSAGRIWEEVIQEIKKTPVVTEILQTGEEKSDIFMTKCSYLCLFMAVQDPPVVLDFSCKPGDPFNKDLFSPFTSSGDIVDYLVWPVTYLRQGGAIMSKGIA